MRFLKRENNDPDAILVKKIINGDVSAFERIVKKHQSRLLTIAYYYLNNSEDAEDAVADLFAHLWQNIGKFKGKSLFSTWLFKVAVNRFYNFRRDRAKHKKVISLDDDNNHINEPAAEHFEQPSSKAEFGSSMEIISKQLSKLPERQRFALVLSKIDGRSYKEIADMTNSSKSAVESLIFRGTTTLRKALLKLKENGEI